MKCFAMCALFLGRCEEPGTSRLSDRLLHGKSLAGDDEQRSFWIAHPENFCDMGPINIRHEMCRKIMLCMEERGLCYGVKWEVRAGLE